MEFDPIHVVRCKWSLTHSRCDEGPGGDIDIQTRNIETREGGKITADSRISSLNAGHAGDIKILFDEALRLDRGSIATSNPQRRWGKHQHREDRLTAAAQPKPGHDQRNRGNGKRR